MKPAMTTKTELADAVVVERTLNAPVAKVWQVLTDVDQMRQWYFDLKEFRPEVGFEFEFVVEHEGNSYRLLDARDGWNYLAIPIAANGSGR